MGCNCHRCTARNAAIRDARFWEIVEPIDRPEEELILEAIDDGSAWATLGIAYDYVRAAHGEYSARGLNAIYEAIHNMPDDLESGTYTVNPDGTWEREDDE